MSLISFGMIVQLTGSSKRNVTEFYLDIHKAFFRPVSCSGFCDFCIQDETNKTYDTIDGGKDWNYRFPCKYEARKGKEGFILQINHNGNVCSFSIINFKIHNSICL